MNNKGNLVLSAAFLLLITFLGLTIMGFSILHSRIQAARTHKAHYSGSMYEELIYYLHHFRDRVFKEDVASFQDPETDFFCSEYFPPVECRNDNNIFIKNSFTRSSTDRTYYRQIRVLNRIEVTSKKTNYSYMAGIYIDLLSGEIPLYFFPFFVNKETNQPLESFMEDMNVLSKSDKNMVVDGMELEFDVTGFLLDSLDIGGSALTWRAMREKFGLPPSDDPVAEGIHRVVEGDVLACLFIQGDVEQIVFSTTDKTQIVRVVQRGVAREFRYKPGEYYFLCLDEAGVHPLLFKERVVVNGSIWCLKQEGEAAFKENGNITLFASGKVVIVSDLETENFELKKIKSTNLTLVTGSEELFNGEKPDWMPDISVDSSGKVRLSVSIITEGNFKNKSPELEVTGSIACKDMENEGVIEIEHRPAGSDTGDFFRTADFKYVDGFCIHYIEEV